VPEDAPERGGSLTSGGSINPASATVRRIPARRFMPESASESRATQRPADPQPSHGDPMAVRVMFISPACTVHLACRGGLTLDCSGRMSLRTRLIIAFLLLSVVPLSAVTFFTYRSWAATFESAARREASQSAADIGRRMERITEDVGRRMDRMFVGAPMPADATGRSSHVRNRVAPMLGETAALVERVEFHPTAAPAPAAPPPRPPWIGPDGKPLPPPPGDAIGSRGPRGRGRWGPPPDAHPPQLPQVIVVDVQQALEEAKRVAEAEMAAAASNLTPLEKDTLNAALPAAAAALKTAAEAARGADAPAALHDMQMQVEGRRVEIDVRQGGKVVGKANATLNLDRTLRTVFAFARRDQGEIPFAIDTRGALHNPDPEQRKTLESFGVGALGPAAADGRPRRVGDWLVVARKDPSGLIFGIARPIGESLREIRRASVRNLSLGLLAIVLALVGIVPISHGMTRHLTSLDAGVRQLAAGDFRTRVLVRSRDEFGSLAIAFNQMAADLERHQALAVEQERLRRELELSRQIQMEMLPRAPLRLGAAEIKGVSIPAREVGGDFFNYFALPDGRLALLVGDVSGKGVSAALLMANVQATLRARLPLETELAHLAADLDADIDETTPGTVYLTLFLGILDTNRNELRYVNAGHNPPFVMHAGGGIEAMPATGLPIALYPGQPYTEATAPVRSDDLLFFYTDGLVEAENDSGDVFGVERLQALLAAEQAHGVARILQRVEDAVRGFRGRAEPLDDATMMALRLNA
jgi:serine phosphatase RsbU (regulator of sigma subunit)